VAGLSLFLALVVGVAAWLTLRTPTYHAPLGGPAPTQASAVRAATLLHDLETAVRRHEPAAGARLGSSPDAGRALGGVVRNGRALHVAGFSLRYVDQAGGVAQNGSWAAYVDARWRFAGFDRHPESLEVRVRFAPHAGHLAIAGIGGGNRRSPLWLAGAIQVRRSPRSLVLVDGTAAEADRMAALARTAVPQVQRVLRSWRGGLVVEVPASQAELQQVLRGHADQYAGIAAVTTTVDGSRSRTAPTHVFVNPQVFLPLKPQGAQVVVTHEATHVATSAATSPAPIWLVEGFADYVALSSQRLPVSTTASRIAALVRRQGPPSHLPGQAEFAPGAHDLEARYESAWLVCRLLARTGGTRSLVALYRAVDDGRPMTLELRRHFGFGLPELTRRWRTLLSHLPT
jgi:hypothetical protein